MIVMEGISSDKNAIVAIGEATEAWKHDPEIIFLFASTAQNANEVAAAIAGRFPGVPVAGCTTSGEHLQGAHSNGTLVLAGIADSGIRWATHLVENLKDVDDDGARHAATSLFQQLDITISTGFDPTDYFALSFIDGLSMMEEKVAPMFADALEGIPLAGGSAGDDLAFAETSVFHAGRAVSNAATLVMGYSDRVSVEIVKHQHFVTTATSLVITKADVPQRRVYEMDGYPAKLAYAAALGVPTEALTSDLAFSHPLTFSCDGEVYVRSVQSINDDNSITFYCGIEEGMVLEIGDHHDMVESLDESIGDVAPADFMLGFNCILRALEAKDRQSDDALSSVVQKQCRSMIGFDTYGELVNGLHINQTLVAVFFRDRAPSA